MSSGVAYTLQIVGQKELDDASLAMCLECVQRPGRLADPGETLSATELCRLRADVRRDCGESCRRNGNGFLLNSYFLL